MTRVADLEQYVTALVDTPRPGVKGVQAFYEHRIGMICTDPRAMLMPWDDHLVHRGDGVFETMKFVDGKLYQLKPHLDRMKRSCRAIKLDPPCSWSFLEDIVKETAKAGGRKEGMVRIMIGRGPGSFGLSPKDCPVSSLYIVVYDLHPRSEEDFEKGVTAFRTKVPAKQPYLATIKSIDYLPNVLMRMEAEKEKKDYPFCFDADGFLAEGATENVCIVGQDNVLYVPEFGNALAGTTLLRAIELVMDEVEVVQRPIAEHEILDAKEVILLGTTNDAISVVRYDGKPIHNVKPGPVSKKMKELLEKDLQENGIPL
ncbi:MAG: aminotransferase class IV [Desulfovibrio sp.]